MEQNNKSSSEISPNIINKLKLASNNYKKAIEKHNLSPLQNFTICVNKNYSLTINCDGDVFDNYSKDEGQPFLKLDIDDKLLERLLDGNLHWDDACLSLKLSWHREPNIFCPDTSNAINYLKL